MQFNKVTFQNILSKWIQTSPEWEQINEFISSLISWLWLLIMHVKMQISRTNCVERKLDQINMFNFKTKIRIVPFVTIWFLCWCSCSTQSQRSYCCWHWWQKWSILCSGTCKWPRTDVHWVQNTQPVLG